MKIRKIYFWLTVLVGIALIALLMTSHFVAAPLVVEEKPDLLPEKEVILIKTETVNYGFLGDVISYKIKILYRASIQIEKISLDQSVNFQPFTVREMKEEEIDLDFGIKMYTREYQLQLLEGKTNYLYQFPTIVVRYQQAGVLKEIKTVPKPLFISIRVPANTQNLKLNPLQGKVTQLNFYDYLPWFILGIGGAMGLMSFWEIFQKFRKKKKKEITYLDELWVAYCHLQKKALARENLEQILHQAYQILQAIFVSEGIVWIEFELEKIPAEISNKVSDLLKKCERAYQRQPLTELEVEIALERLREILEFYRKKGMKND